MRTILSTLCCCLLISFNAPAQGVVEEGSSIKEASDVVLQISEEDSELDLEVYSVQAEKQGVLLDFEEVHYSEEGRITELKISYEIPETGTKGTFSRGETEGIGQVSILLKKDHSVSFISGDQSGIKNAISPYSYQLEAPQHDSIPGKERYIIISGDHSSYVNPPLFVVDGIVQESGFSPEDIDPEDIQSITVLKGDRATQKYGAKAAQGAIEIQLKKDQ